MTEPIPHEIDDDSDLKSLLRDITGYDEADISTTELESQIRIAKLRIKLKSGSTDFYSDDGLSLALFGASAITAKSTAENYAVDSWDVGAASIDVRNAGSEEQQQFTDWAQLVKEGLMAADSSKKVLPSITKTYIG